VAELAVVLVHWNQPDRCARTARAFLGQGLPLRLAVVDNGSTEGALDALVAGLPPDAEVVRLGSNRGFGPAANVGLARWLASGRGEWAVVAPHDAIPEPGCLERMLDAARRRPRAGLASAEFGERLRPVIDPYFGGIQARSEAGPGWEDADHPHGTLMLARRAGLEQVGLFDERYFAYCEEADLALRARAAGWEVGIVWGAVVRNPSVSVSSPVVEYLQLRNTLLLVREHFGRYRATIRLLFAVAGTALQLTRPARRTPIFSARARWQAVADFSRARFGAPPEWLVAGG
jgi:GT2 family glycosyltransferase